MDPHSVSVDPVCKVLLWHSWIKEWKFEHGFHHIIPAAETNILTLEQMQEACKSLRLAMCIAAAVSVS